MSSRLVAATLAAGTAILLASCGGPADEPAGLSTDRATSTASDTPEPEFASGTATAAPSQDPSRKTAVVAPDGVTPEQQAVLDAYGAYTDAVDVLVRTNDLDASGIRDHATGAMLQTWEDYVVESARIQRTSDGPSLRVRAYSVDVTDGTAHLSLCLDESFWVDIVAGQATLLPELLYFDVTMRGGSGSWKVTEQVAGDAARCSA